MRKKGSVGSVSEPSVFGLYSAYYDLLYCDKDYGAEAAFVNEQLKLANLADGRLLEFGCGTGAHAEHLIKLGYTITGVDQSAEMLEAAAARRAGFADHLVGNLTLVLGRISDVSLGESFAGVVSLFHVMSYQSDTVDLLKTFRAARAHLEVGGIFLFDFWYGPAVLSEQPLVRVKRMANRTIEVTRISEPRLLAQDNAVDVAYQVFVRNRATGHVEEFSESHRMRYFFVPELVHLLGESGFVCDGVFEWMTSSVPTTRSWAAYAIARAQ